jgi:hypothetical protein
MRGGRLRSGRVVGVGVRWRGSWGCPFGVFFELMETWMLEVCVAFACAGKSFWRV